MITFGSGQAAMLLPISRWYKITSEQLPTSRKTVCDVVIFGALVCFLCMAGGVGYLLSVKLPEA